MQLARFTGVVLLVGLFLFRGATLPAGEVEKLTEQLRTAQGSRRVAAISTLASYGPAAAPAVPDLVRLLLDKDLVVQHEAIVALGSIGPAAAEAVPSLAKLLDNRLELLQHSAVHALRMIGPTSKPAAPRLSRLLEGDDSVLAVAAAWALIEINSGDEATVKATLPVLAKGLASTDDSVRADSVLALAATADAGVEPLVKLAAFKDAVVATGAIDALAAIGPAAESAVPVLVRATSRPDRQVAWHAARALGTIASDADQSVPALLALTGDESAAVRFSAARALGSFGDQAEQAVPELARLLTTDSDEPVKRAAALSLRQIGPAAKKAVPALIDALQGDSGAVTIESAEALSAIGAAAVPAITRLLDKDDYRELAIHILGEIGPDAEPAAPKLTNLLQNAEMPLLSELLLALASIGPGAAPAASETLLERLRDPKSEARAGVAYALASLEVKEAVPLLQKTVEDPDDELLRLASAWGLVMFEPENTAYVKLALPRLIGGLTSERPRIRLEVARALGRIGSQAKVAVPELILATSDADPAVQVEVLSALAAIGPDAAEAVPAALQHVGSPNQEIRGTAVFLLGRIGPAAKDAVPVLRQMLTSRAEFDRILAAWGLVHITPEDPAARKTAVPFMLRAVQQSERDPVRAEAARTLGEIGAGAPLVRTTLQRVAEMDPSAEVRAAATMALDKLK